MPNSGPAGQKVQGGVVAESWLPLLLLLAAAAAGAVAVVTAAAAGAAASGCLRTVSLYSFVRSRLFALI